jgi:hypothetical protein
MDEAASRNGGEEVTVMMVQRTSDVHRTEPEGDISARSKRTRTRLPGCVITRGVDNAAHFSYNADGKQMFTFLFRCWPKAEAP